MTKEQAIEAMKKGAKVRHKYFFPGEYITSDEQGRVFDQNNNQLDEYWRWRQKFYDTGWEAYPVQADKCFHPGTIPIHAKQLYEYKDWQEFINHGARWIKDYEQTRLLHVTKSGIVVWTPSDIVTAWNKRDFPVKVYELSTYQTLIDDNQVNQIHGVQADQ